MTQERYIRNLPALSEAECALLKEKRVLIAGCGGLGGYLLELMLRLGVGAVRVVDGDCFEPTNLNRQMLSDMSNLGENKAKAAAERARKVNPDVCVEAFSYHMDKENAHELVSGCDVVLDGLDNVESRRVLAEACAGCSVPYIFGAVDGWAAQAAVSMPGDGLIDALYPELSGEAAVKAKGILCFAPAICASVQAALCTKLLLGQHIETGKLYYFDLFELDFETVDMA